MEDNLNPFYEISVNGNEPAWCIDGRKESGRTKKGAQMPGGSIFPILLAIIEQNEDFSAENINRYAQKLSKKFKLGVHRGEHGGCGFANNLIRILLKITEKEEEIKERLKDFETNSVYESLKGYSLLKVKVTGEELISDLEKQNAVVMNLVGEHEERAAFVNLKDGTTLDVLKANESGSPAFNLDLWMIVKQAKELGVNEDFARIASLIIYLATEMVLVEDKGKPALDIIVHK